MGLQKFLKDRFEVNLYPMSNKLPTEKKLVKSTCIQKFLKDRLKNKMEEKNK